MDFLQLRRVLRWFSSKWWSFPAVKRSVRLKSLDHLHGYLSEDKKVASPLDFISANDPEKGIKDAALSLSGKIYAEEKYIREACLCGEEKPAFCIDKKYLY